MAKHNDVSPEGRSVRLLRVGEQFRHILSELLARGDVHDSLLCTQYSRLHIHYDRLQYHYGRL